MTLFTTILGGDMNERLTQIYRSCRPKEALSTQDEYKSANVLLGSEVEKFAELIVKECVKIAYQNDVAKFTRDGYVIGQEIEKHFGVE